MTHPIKIRFLALRTARAMWMAVCVFAGLSVAAASGVTELCVSLKDSCAIATRSSDHRGALHAGELLQKAAGRTGDSYFLAYSYYYQGISNVILGNSAVGKAQLDKALELAEKADDDTLRLSVINGFGIYEANVHTDYARAQQHFYRSLEYAVRIGDPLRQALIECNLAEIASMRRDTTGLKYARNCYEWGMANHNAHVSFTGAYHCANLSNQAGDHAAALRYIREADRISQRENFAERSAVFNLYASIYAAMGHQREALEYLRKAEAHASAAQGATLPEIYLNYARILAGLGRTAESDRMIRRGLEVSDSLQIISSVAAFLEQKSLNLERRGDYRGALEAYKTYKQICDSSFAERQARQINELRVLYDIDKREHQADMHSLQLQNERRKTVILLVSLLSAIVILLILGRFYWRQKRLYRRIVISNRDALAREEALMARLASATEHSAVPSAEAETGTDGGEPLERAIPRSEDLYTRLTELMENERIYRDSNLTRDRLAEILGTNRTYLTQIIAQHSGKGYYQYLNSFRIKEAVKILSDPANTSYPLKALAADLGFKSMSTFYKTFQETVGMTPSMYRDTASSL